jgi:F0F1-type ATP synthase epsilon subunit
MKGQQPLTLRVHNRDGVVFEGKVENLTSYNEVGEFDVLSLHARFISMIQDYLIIRLLDGEERRIDLDTAIMRVDQNFVEVFMGVTQEGGGKTS